MGIENTVQQTAWLKMD